MPTIALERFPINPTASAAHSQLCVLFPHCDPGFVEQCIAHWLSRSPPASASTGSSTTYRRATTWTTQSLVERVTNKLLEVRPEGEWPRVPPSVRCRAGGDAPSIASSSQVRRAFGRTTSGRGDAGLSAAATASRRTRTHAMFPLVPVVDLRDLILAQPHSALFECANILAQRSTMPLKRDSSTALGADLLEAAAAAFSRLFGGGGSGDGPARPRTRPGRSKKGKELARPAIDPHGDPVLTPHDLFHSPAHDTALVAHFCALFPALAPLSSAPIERVVRREGGSYASMRERLERAAADAEDERDRPWWSRWIGGPAASARGAGATATGGSSSRRRGTGRTGARATAEVHPLIRREVEAFERAQHAPPAARGPESQEAGLALGSGALVECQCCFTAVPYSSSQLAGCSDLDTPADLPASPPDPHTPPHFFCRDCVLAYAGTFTFGGTPLPSVALERSALPCISASGSSPCGRVFRRDELVKVLDAPTFAAFSAQITSATLEPLALPRSSSSAPGAKLLRCPFCPYAELADPVPGPLARTFLPAWVAEPFPPSPSQILYTLLGSLALVLLLLLTALVALLSPARRLERTYAALYPPDTGASQQHQPSLLTLPERLLLAPHHLPSLCAAYVRRVVERVLRDKDGEAQRVFRCRNDGAPLGPERDASGEVRGRAWLARLEAVQELEWDDEQEGVAGDEGEVEERRRAALVRFLWGPSGLDNAAQHGARESAEPPSCGKLSCLLCSAAVNPSAPSLHACRASTSAAAAPGAEPASEQERAEESLRLAVERAMSDAVKRDCGRCGAALQKETGNGACNKVVCRCGFIYCHACRREIPSWQGYGHFCPHPRDPSRVRRSGDRACDECGKCSLWDEPDEVERVKVAVERARAAWAAEHPAWAKKVDLETPIAFQPDAQEVPVYEWLADGFDALVESVVHPPPPHLPGLTPSPTPPRNLSPSRPARTPPKVAPVLELTPAAAMSPSEPDPPRPAACEPLPTTELLGTLKVRVVEAKGLAVPDSQVAKPYVLLQYDRTDSVSREWGAPPPEERSEQQKKKGVRRKDAPTNGKGEVTRRRVVGGASDRTAASSSSTAAPTPISSAFSSNRSTAEANPPPIASLASVDVRPPKPPPLLPSNSHTLRPIDPSLPDGDPSVIGTPSSPIWNHTATFDVVSPGRTILLCVYDRLAPQGGPAGRLHGFLGACLFLPPLLGLEGEEVDRGEDGEGLDVWVPVTSALDSGVGGEIRLRLLFEPLLSRPKLTVDDFQILRRIGQGSFGQVFRVRKRDTKRIYAMKVIRKASVTTPEALAQVIAERQVLARTTDSPFLIGLKFSFQSDNELFLVIDYKSGGEVFQHLQRDGGRFDEAKVRFYVAEIILALEYLHDNNIVYRDLKPENCLLDGSGHVVLCDFGLSKLLESPDGKCRTLCGTTAFVAP
ncbi:hypothetical protein JCM9279_007598, partial [Rhodotorula babjevae]